VERPYICLADSPPRTERRQVNSELLCQAPRRRTGAHTIRLRRRCFARVQRRKPTDYRPNWHRLTLLDETLQDATLGRVHRQRHLVSLDLIQRRARRDQRARFLQPADHLSLGHDVAEER